MRRRASRAWDPHIPNVGPAPAPKLHARGHGAALACRPPPGPRVVDADPRRAREGGAACDDHGGRKRREGGGPEGKHIAFVPNSPSLDPDAPCPRRWGIEINYQMPRQTRMRTPARRACQDLLLCGVAHGAQRAGHAALGQGGRRIPKAALSSHAAGVLLEYGVQPWLRPPRKPPP